MTARSKALQIYMKPGVAEDDLMLAIWEAARRSSRPQDVFRAMLRAGLRAMVESGEMPDAVVRECELDEVLERRRRRESRNAETRSRVAEAHPAMHVPHFAPPYPYGYAPQVPMPMHPMPQPGYAQPHPVASPVPVAAPAAVPVAPQPVAPPAERAVRPEALAQGVATALESAAAEARIQRDAAADTADHREAAASAAAAPARKGRIGTLM